LKFLLLTSVNSSVYFQNKILYQRKAMTFIPHNPENYAHLHVNGPATCEKTQVIPVKYSKTCRMLACYM